MSPACPLHLGVDPGDKGAWALLDAAGALVEARHFAHDDEGFVDLHDLLGAWRDRGIVHATVEKVGQITRVKGRAMGIAGRFNYGLNCGVPRAALRLLGIPYDYVDPVDWKRAVGVTSDKKTSLAAARQIWPGHADATFRRVMDADRAEAALLARHGLRARLHLRRAA